METGMSISELVGLTLDDVTIPAHITRDGYPGTVRIRRKRGKVQDLPLSQLGVSAAVRLSQVASRRAVPSTLAGQVSRPLNKRRVRELFHRPVVGARVPWAHQYTLRTTRISPMLHNRAYNKTVQDYVGHTSLASTSRYVGALKQDEIKMV